MIAALFENPRDDILLANMALGDVLDRHPALECQRCGAVSHPVSLFHRELRVVEDADPVGTQIPGHPLGIADAGQCPGDHNPIIAGQHPGDPVVVALRQRLAHGIPRKMTLSTRKPTPNLSVPALPA